MNYYLAIDIGTTSAKAVAFSESGEAISGFTSSYEMKHPKPDQSELNPDDIFEAVIEGIKNVVQNLAPANPLFISFSAAMHSLIAVDEKGNLLTQCIIWADNRAGEIAEKLKNSDEAYHFYHSTGVPIHSMSPFCKLLWIRQYQPSLFKTAFKFIGIKEYIFFKLFGSFLIDTSIASATGLLNIHKLQWDEEILNFLELPSSKLSEVVSAKHICYYKNNYSNLLLPAGLPFIIGASDGALSNLGTGAIGPNTMCVTIGTSSAARLLINEPETDSRMRTFCYHLKDNFYVAGGAGNNGAVVLQWLKENVLQTNESYEAFFELAKTIAPGSDGLLLLPYILGERAPVWNANAKGVYFGLNIQHTKAYLIRAAMEGVVYSVYSIGKIIGEKKEVTEIRASGGFTKSTVWLQILADVFNIKIAVPATVESAAFGAAVLGKEAMGFDENFPVKKSAIYNPDSYNHEIYQKSFAKFERLYDLLKVEMTNES